MELAEINKRGGGKVLDDYNMLWQPDLELTMQEAAMLTQMQPDMRWTNWPTEMFQMLQMLKIFYAPRARARAQVYAKPDEALSLSIWPTRKTVVRKVKLKEKSLRGKKRAMEEYEWNVGEWRWSKQDFTVIALGYSRRVLTSYQDSHWFADVMNLGGWKAFEFFKQHEKENNLTRLSVWNSRT